MRKQYHLRTGSGGLDAWDVDRLVELTRGLALETVELSELSEIDDVYWFGPGSELPTVRRVAEHARLMDKADLSYPVILDPDGAVMDGMHRIAKALVDGRPAVLAVRLLFLPEPDYRNCRPDELPY